jgi:hypothetical protein
MFFKPNLYILGQSKCVWRGNLSRKNYFSTYLKGTLACEIFWSGFCTDQTYIGQIISILSVFNFVLEFADLFKFLPSGSDSVDAESHSPSTESTLSETPRQLSQRRMMKSSKMLVASALAQLPWRLTPHWLSWGKSHSALTQLTGNLTLRRPSVRKTNQAKRGRHNQLWRL